MSLRHSSSRAMGAPGRARRSWLLLLALILLLGATLRFTGLNWDDNKHLHPDERFLTMVENSLSWPDSISEYFDTANSPLNPYNKGHSSYVYGLLPVVLTKALGQLTGLTGYDGVYLAGRALSGIMDLLCVLMVYAIGARLYDRRVGLLGAALLALSVLDIQHAHFFTVDTATTFFVTLSLYWAVRVAQADHWRHRIMLGISFGLAVACKVSALSLGLVVALAFLLAAWRRGEAEAPQRHRSRRLGRYWLRGEVRNLHPARGIAWDWVALKGLELLPAALIVGLCALLAFRIAQPYAFEGPGFFGVGLNAQWKDDMSYISKLVSGEIDYPPSHQWTSRAPVWYMWKNMVLWGMGLPLGLAVWAGWGLMGWELLKGRRQHLLPWAWMSFTFFYQSIQFVKAMRYILPIYPTMALVAAYGLISLWDAVGKVGCRRWLRLAGRTAVALVVIGTALWAAAFTSIYTRPVSRITASRWIYDNIPQGASLSYELWDDALPLNIDGRLAGNDYEMIRMEPYGEDTPEKREALLRWLDQTEYIILSSNRLYGSIPRLAQRYPMTTRYYEMLFSGELGYEQVAEFVSRPRILGIEFVDDDADESFTVYDHPRVLIFRKTARFDLASIQDEFEDYDLERIVRVMPRQVDDVPNQLMLSDEALAQQRAGGTWSDLYQENSLANQHPTLFWLLALYAVQAAAWPLMTRLSRALPDRGHGLSKAWGLLLVAYGSWMAPSLGLARYSSLLVWALLLTVAGIGALLLWRYRAEYRELFKRLWRLMLTEEALFVALFGLMWLIRRANPDLWHPVMGGEKPMDLAYFNAVLKSSTFPPYDPWFSGGAMNYYYFGWVVVGVLVKLTGILPEVAYNLALPTLFALLGVGVTTVVQSLASHGDEDGRFWPRGLRVGLVGMALVCLTGNLGELQLLLQGLVSLGGARTAPGTPALGRLLVGFWAKIATGATLPFRDEWWYWNATRVMGHGEISEFPFFSYLYGDLHAHVMALPFTVLALGLAINFAMRLKMLAATTNWREMAAPPTWMNWLARCSRTLWGAGAALSLTLGALWCMNTWDWPTYMGLTLVALVIAAALGAREDKGRAVVVALSLGALIALVGRLLFQPYHAHYGLGYDTVDLWKGERTSLAALVILWALPVFVLWCYFARRASRGALGSLVRYWRMQQRYGRQRVRRLMGVLAPCDLALDASTLAAGAVFLLMVLALIGGWWTMLVAVPLGILALCEVMAAPTLEGRLVALFGGAFAFLVVFVDWFVLGGDVGRMNTVFKLSLQAWVLAGIAMAVALPYLLDRRARWAPAAKVFLGILLVAATLYAPFATYGRLIDRWPDEDYVGLNGMAYMARASYQDGEHKYALAQDAEAIHWLRDNVRGSPVIVEAVTPLYRWGGRVSVYTGLPTVLGWDWHQRQQRSALSGLVVDWRAEDVARLYNTTDLQETVELIERYDVSLIYVGQVERAYYDPSGLAKFDEMVGTVLDRVYQRDTTRIYAVRGANVIFDARAQSPLVEWLQRHVVWGAVHADDGAAEPDDVLLLDVPVDELPVARVGWNEAGNAHWPLALLCWYLALQLMGWGAFGLVAPAFRGLDDRGHGLAKGLGLVLVSLLVWLPASMGARANTSPVVWAVAVSLALVGAILARRLGAWRDVNWRAVALQEGLFALALLAFVLIRLLNPDLWQPWYGGEKLMESAYLQAVARSESMPPYDPYFAGGQLNYYYYGLFQANIPLKLTGLRPEIAFNLAVPTLFALTASHTFWAGRQLAGRNGLRANWRAGAMSALLVVLMGNLTAPLQLLEQVAQLTERPMGPLGNLASGLIRLASGSSLPTFDYWWRSTRVISFTINEFPFFSFLFADLHPHLTALSLTTLVLGLLASAVQSEGSQRWALGLLTAACFGALGPANTWDLPTYALAVMAVGLIWGLAKRGWRRLALGLAWGLAVVSLGVALYLPFYLCYRAQNLGLNWVAAEARSPLGQWIQVWGVFLLGLVCWLAVSRQGDAGGKARQRWVGLGVLAAALGGGVGLLLIGEAVLGVLLPLLIAAGMLWWRRRAEPLSSMRAMLMVLGVGILAGVELVYVSDFLDGSEWSRMNTVFKFHLQAWVILGIALGSRWPWLWQRLRHSRWPGRLAGLLLPVLMGASLLYGVLATPVRVAERMPYGQAPRWTLDGMAFMQTTAYDWPDEGDRIELRYDLEAIRWLQQHAEGNAIVAEAPIGYYREGGLRVSSFTGLPTLVGMHQGEQRPWSQVTLRQQQADTLYTASDPERVAHLLRELDVRYVYYGQLEQAAYPYADQSAFVALERRGQLQRVFENERTVIWSCGQGS